MTLIVPHIPEMLLVLPPTATKGSLACSGKRAAVTSNQDELSISLATREIRINTCCVLIKRIKLDEQIKTSASEHICSLSYEYSKFGQLQSHGPQQTLLRFSEFPLPLGAMERCISLTEILTQL